MRSWTRSGALDRQRADFDEGANQPSDVESDSLRRGKALLGLATAERRLSKADAFAEDAPKRGSGWYNDAGSVWVQRQSHVFVDQLNRHRVELCEIAFAADRRMNSGRKSSGTAAG